MDSLEILPRLGVALALGLLIGLERGWEKREREGGERFAGLRTFGVVGLFGGISAVLVFDSANLIIGGALAGLALISAVGYWRTSQDQEDLSATTSVTILVAYALGALAGRGELVPAVSAAVVVTLLLGFKPELHAIVERIERPELLATFKLLLIAVVLLPVLPDRGLGPWQALNPYQIWWMVVLIAALSYVGYFAIKLMGSRLGLVVTGIFGGLASSTATAVELARHATRSPRLEGLLTGAIVIASGIMFPRMLLVAAVNPHLVVPLSAPLLIAGSVAFAIGGSRMWRLKVLRSGRNRMQVRTQNPLDLWTAIRFGAILAAIMFASRAALALGGNRALLGAAGLAGLADVDSITLSLATMAAASQITPAVAVAGILLAAAINTLIKPGAVIYIKGFRMGWKVAWPLLTATAAGALGFLIPAALG